MNRSLLQLLVIAALVFMPIGQAFAANTVDFAEQVTLDSDCNDCDAHQEADTHPCPDSHNLSHGCTGTTVSPLAISPDSQLAPVSDGLSSGIGRLVGSRYLSQIPAPLSRPPIA